MTYVVLGIELGDDGTRRISTEVLYAGRNRDRAFDIRRHTKQYGILELQVWEDGKKLFEYGYNEEWGVSDWV